MTKKNEITQVMKAGITASQRRRRGDVGLTLAVDPQTRRLLRLEEVGFPPSNSMMPLRLQITGMLMITNLIQDRHSVTCCGVGAPQAL